MNETRSYLLRFHVSHFLPLNVNIRHFYGGSDAVEPAECEQCDWSTVMIALPFSRSSLALQPSVAVLSVNLWVKLVLYVVCVIRFPIVAYMHYF